MTIPMDRVERDWYDVARAFGDEIDRAVGRRVVGEQELAELFVLVRGGLKWYALDSALDQWSAGADDYGHPFAWLRTTMLRHQATRYLGMWEAERSEAC